MNIKKSYIFKIFSIILLFYSLQIKSLPVFKDPNGGLCWIDLQTQLKNNPTDLKTIDLILKHAEEDLRTGSTPVKTYISETFNITLENLEKQKVAMKSNAILQNMIKSREEKTKKELASQETTLKNIVKFLESNKGKIVLTVAAIAGYAYYKKYGVPTKVKTTGNFLKEKGLTALNSTSNFLKKGYGWLSGQTAEAAKSASDETALEIMERIKKTVALETAAKEAVKNHLQASAEEAALMQAAYKINGADDIDFQTVLSISQRLKSDLLAKKAAQIRAAVEESEKEIAQMPSFYSDSDNLNIKKPTPSLIQYLSNTLDKIENWFYD